MARPRPWWSWISKPWDLAAIKIIIEEAGGRFTDFNGVATIYGGDAIASNGLVHDEILELLRSPHASSRAS